MIEPGGSGQRRGGVASDAPKHVASRRTGPPVDMDTHSWSRLEKPSRARTAIAARRKRATVLFSHLAAARIASRSSGVTRKVRRTVRFCRPRPR